MPEDTSQDYVRARCPRGLRRRLRREVAGLNGVARAGGARRWWCLGLRAPAISVWTTRDDRLHFDVCVGAESGVNVLELGRRVQDTVSGLARDEDAPPIAAIDVYIEPGL